MAQHTITFENASATVTTGTLIVEAAAQAGIALNQPCGGQGRCGRCAVQVTAGSVRRRSSLRLSPDDVAAGWALACQSVIEADATIHVPPQEQIERRLTTDRTAVEVSVPAGYDPAIAQTVQRIRLTLPPPGLDDQTDDWSRLRTAQRREAEIERLWASLDTIRTLGRTLREGHWQVTATLDQGNRDMPDGAARLIRANSLAGTDSSVHIHTMIYGGDGAVYLSTLDLVGTHPNHYGRVLKLNLTTFALTQVGDLN